MYSFFHTLSFTSPQKQKWLKLSLWKIRTIKIYFFASYARLVEWSMISRQTRKKHTHHYCFYFSSNVNFIRSSAVGQCKVSEYVVENDVTIDFSFEAKKKSQPLFMCMEKERNKRQRQLHDKIIRTEINGWVIYIWKEENLKA